MCKRRALPGFRERLFAGRLILCSEERGGSLRNTMARGFPMRRLTILLVLLSCVTAFSAVAHKTPGDKGTRLFDGKTFAGWEGDMQKTWRIENGALVGGSLLEATPHNAFLATTREYTNFDLRLKFKLI